MGCKRQIIIVTANRTEQNLLEPVYAELKKNPRFNLKWLYIDQYAGQSEILNKISTINTPDLIILPTDRIEIFPVLNACIARKIRVAHFEAGYPFTGGTYDDVVRWSVSLWADIIFCNSVENYRKTVKICKILNKKAKIFHVGSTAFDYPIDYSKVPSTPFDIVMYNPPTLKLENIRPELETIFNLLNKYTLWFDPNGDEGSETVIKVRNELIKKSEIKIKTVKNYPKPQFLGVLKKCDRIIGNSSCLWNEAPYLKVKTVPIGVRNKYRKKIKVWKGASKRISKILGSLI
jgi:UDP-N-acetylglucosamine 2-epimerase